MIRRSPDRHSRTVAAAVAVQVVLCVSLGAALALSPAAQREQLARLVTRRDVLEIPVPPRSEPLAVAPLYDRPDIVSDADLAAVLEQVLPRFPRRELNPNFVEHAVRVWGVAAEFHDPDVLDGAELRDFLTDHARFTESWSDREARPLINFRAGGIAVRFGPEPGASVHHDHWLASLTEAGISLNAPVYGPGRRGTIADVLRQSLRDFRLDELETEWTAMAFGLWLPPTREWVGADGRHYSFDLLVERLLRGHPVVGVCSGTHRVYSLVLLIRLDNEFDILTDAAHDRARHYLRQVRDALVDSQLPDGQWPSNWSDGRSAAQNPLNEEVHRQIIATGHHLEWLAIAPPELHPPDEQIRRAARWAIDTTVAQTPEQILEHYTFYSHVGNALALWRSRRPAEFWSEWNGRAAPTIRQDASGRQSSAPTADAGL